MLIHVLGKQHLEGHSKRTGKDYNFHQIHFLSGTPFVDGLSATTINIDPSFIPYDKIIVGGVYRADFDFRGYLCSFSLIREEPLPALPVE